MINFQLAGGVWTLQTLPAVFLALFVPWLNRWAVAAGWLVGTVWGTAMLIQEHFEGSVHMLGFLGENGVLYIAFIALIANMAVVVTGSALARALDWRPCSGLSRHDYEPTLAAVPATDPLALEPETTPGAVR